MSDFIKDRAFEVWEAHGLECAMVYGPFGGANGYVRVPEDQRSMHYDDFDGIEVHGGLTYGVDESGWVGFDTAHAGDLWSKEFVSEHHLHRGVDFYDGVSHFRPEWAVEWTIDKMRAEVENLARQLKEAS